MEADQFFQLIKATVGLTDGEQYIDKACLSGTAIAWLSEHFLASNSASHILGEHFCIARLLSLILFYSAH